MVTRLLGESGFDLDDLVKLGVLAFFLLGPALGAIIKKLSAKTPEDAEAGPATEEGDKVQPSLRVEQGPAPLVTARPAASPLSGSSPTGPPTARPAPQQVILSPQGRRRLEMGQSAAGRPPSPVHLLGATAMPGPGGPGPLDMRDTMTYARPRTPSGPHGEPNKNVDAVPDDHHLPHLQSRLAKRPITSPTSRGGGPPSQPRTAERMGDDPGLIRHLTNRPSLRRAIVLSEILGPPLALRPSDERF